MIYRPHHIKGNAHALWYNGGQTKLNADEGHRTGKLTSNHQIRKSYFHSLCVVLFTGNYIQIGL